jgi:hypothetical protein
LDAGSFGKKCIQRCGVVSGAQFCHHFAVAHHAGYAGKRLEVIGASSFRGQQQEHQIDWLIVQSLKIHRLIQPREHADNTVQAWQLAMRNSNAIANSGGAKPFALQNDVKDFTFRQAGYFRSLSRQFLQ